VRITFALVSEGFETAHILRESPEFLKPRSGREPIHEQSGRRARRSRLQIEDLSLSGSRTEQSVQMR
jgi:hypothetical protein